MFTVDQFELSDGSKVIDLLELLENEGIFKHYGKNSVIVLVNDRLVNDNYVLHDGEKIQLERAFITRHQQTNRNCARIKSMKHSWQSRKSLFTYVIYILA